MRSIRYGLLGLLEQQSDHGYRLWQRFEDGVGQVWQLNVGQVYQTLPTLAEAGLVDVFEENDPDKPGTRRRRFEITAKGKKALSNWSKRTPVSIEPTRDGMLVLLLVVAEAHPDIARSQIASKERTYRQHLVRLRRRQRKIAKSDRPDIIVPLLSIDFAILRTKAYLTWLERCRLLLDSGDIGTVWPQEDD